MSFKPFPILRLPQLAQEEAMKQMRSTDNFTLALTSARTQNMVKVILSRYKYELLLVDSRCWFGPESNMETESYFDIGDMKTFDKDCVKFGRQVDETKVRKFLKGVRNTFEKYTLNLDIKSSYLVILLSSSIKSLNFKVNRVEIETDAGTDAETYHISLIGFTNASHLGLRTRKPAYFHGTNLPVYDFDRVYIQDASWVTERDVYEKFWNCKHVKMDNCDFDSDKNLVYPIVEKWIEGSKLERLSLRSDNEDCFGFVPSVLGGIPFKAKKQVRSLYNDIYKRREITFNYGYEVKRNDKEALVVCVDEIESDCLMARDFTVDNTNTFEEW